MAKIFEGQTALSIRLVLYEDLTDKTNRVLIKYRKPNGIESWWPAEIIDYELGIIEYQIPTNSDGLDDTGFWTMWAYVYYKDGSVTAGEAVDIGVYQEGKSYIAFPYGRKSSVGEVESMAQEAYEIIYNNATSGLVSTNVQDGMDELSSSIDGFANPAAADIVYSNTASGLVATNVQTGMDEIDLSVDTIVALIAQTSTIVYTDVGRLDSYVEDGTIHRPYKTIAAAIAVAPTGSTIKVAAGTYTGNIVLPNNVSLMGIGINKTIFTGTVGTNSLGNSSIKDLTISNTLTVSNSTAINNVAVDNAVISADVKAYNLSASTSTANALSVTAGHVYLDGSVLTATSASAVTQSGGTLILDNCDIDNNHGTNQTVISTSGVIRIQSSTVNNAGAGEAISVNNGAISTAPNVLANIIHVGGISAGTAYTVQEGIEGAEATGTAFSKRPAVQIAYDNSSTSLTATDSQAAIDESYGSCKSGTADPVYSPTRTPEFFYRTDTTELFIHNGTSWNKVALV